MEVAWNFSVYWNKNKFCKIKFIAEPYDLLSLELQSLKYLIVINYLPRIFQILIF